MAAGEYQAQPVVTHVVLLRRFLLEQLQRGAMALIAARFAAQMVERAVARGGDDPAGGRGRYAVLRPARERDGEGVLDRFLGELDVAEEAHQHGNRAAMLAAEDRFDLRAQCPSMNGRTSIGVPMARASLRPQRERRVEIRRLEDGDAADLLLALDERTVGRDDLATLVAQHGGGTRRRESAAEYPHAGGLHFLLDRMHVAHDSLQGVGRRLRAAGGITHGKQVLLH